MITAGITANAKRFNQRLEDYFLAIGTYPSERGQIEDFQLIGAFKYYINYSEVAPDGMYVFAEYAQGLANAKGHFFDSRINVLETYIIDNIRSQRLSLGFGQQTILWNKVTLGYDFGATFANLDIGSTVNLQHALAFESFADRYGPNVYSFGEWHATGGFGLSVHLKMGVLLF